MLEPLLDEGGQTDLTRSEMKAWTPWERRYLKVAQPDVPDAPEGVISGDDRAGWAAHRGHGFPGQ